ncbi:2,4-dihydroxyhept-2-ene-1,7-dioic acid aldolase-like protein [Cenococcum geophilum]
MFPGTSHSRAIARSGVNWICVDTKHGNVDAVAAIASCGASPAVRIAASEAWIVKRALDAGAHGICVPLLYTADDARRLVSSANPAPYPQTHPQPTNTSNRTCTYPPADPYHPRLKPSRASPASAGRRTGISVAADMIVILAYFASTLAAARGSGSGSGGGRGATKMSYDGR